MKKLNGRDMVYKLAIAKKVNEIIDVLIEKEITTEDKKENIERLIKNED